MEPTYRIRGWTKHYEHADHKKHPDVMKWVKITTAQDSIGFRHIATEKDGASIMGVWLMIVEVAAKCTVRGTLADRQRPLTSYDFSIVTGHPKKIFDRALKVLSSEKVGWLEVVTQELLLTSSRQTLSTTPNHTPQDHTTHNQIKEETKKEEPLAGVASQADGSGIGFGNASGMAIGSAANSVLASVRPRPLDRSGGFDFEDMSAAKNEMMSYGVSEAVASDLIKDPYVTYQRVKVAIKSINRDRKVANRPGCLVARMKERRAV